MMIVLCGRSAFLDALGMLRDIIGLDSIPTLVSVSASLCIPRAALLLGRRTQVRDLVEKVYNLAEALIIPAVQLELCTKFDEPFITPKIFMDYFNQVGVSLSGPFRLYIFFFSPSHSCPF